MNISRALEIPGMMSEGELEFLAELASGRECIVEIGSWMGRSARAMADNTQGMMYCVDTWQDDAFGPAPADVTCEPDWLYRAFKRNMGDHFNDTVGIFRGTSQEGASYFASMSIKFDMIFIDAGHSYDDVVADIFSWRPLLREGGIFCGHDLYKDGPYHPGVKQAVDELIVNYTVTGTIWVAQ